MAYIVTLRASTGCFDATIDTRSNVLQLVQMVSAGAQVQEGWEITLYDTVTKAQVVACGQSTSGMYVTTECLLDALENMPRRARGRNAEFMVTVPVRLGVYNGHDLPDAEDFVRGAIMTAIKDHQNVCSMDKTPVAFAVMGEVVSIGSAKEA